MDEDQLERLAASGRFIPGIYNYCDRWCERCPLASKCMTRAIELEDADGNPDQDAGNEKFWGKIGEVFAVTMRMLEQHCREMGLELTEADLKAAGDAERRRHVKVRRSALSKQAMKYGDLVTKWFDKKPELMEKRQKMLLSIAEMELPGHDPAADATDIVDAVEIVRWYQYFIGVKTSRAIGGLVDREEDGDDGQDFHESDANGSAKIALIAVDRSLGAWSRLRDQFPDEGDRVLDLLVYLDRLRRTIEQTFPSARDFKRPGFDDVVANAS